MRLDIYLNDELDTTISVSVQQETRHEVRYRIPIPAGTASIRMVSVGGATSQRACMQELYLLQRKPDDPSDLPQTPNAQVAAYKKIVNGQVVIVRGSSIFTTLGQRIQ